MRDRDLLRLHWPVELRPAFDALFGLDDAMADVVVKAREPQLAAIKLAWWREQLQALDVSPPPAEPRLQAAARELLPRGITGGELAELEDGWSCLVSLGEPHSFMGAADRRGPLLFRLAARLLGVEDQTDWDEWGREFAVADIARRGIFDLVPIKLGQPYTKPSRGERPLTSLAALARRDMRRGGPPFEPQGTPGRSWTLIWHRLTGRL